MELEKLKYNQQLAFGDEVYLAKLVDPIIAEKDAEIELLKRKLEDVTSASSITCEAVRKCNKEIRGLQRALWISRAKAYQYIAELVGCFTPAFIRNRRMFIPNNLEQKQMDSLGWARLMLNVERKCRAMAEKYKEGK